MTLPGNHYFRPQARLACGHMKTWPEVTPRKRDVVYCYGCDDWLAITYSFVSKTGRPPVLLCSETTKTFDGRRVVELRCTEPKQHGPDHFDESLGRKWPREG